MRAKLEEAETRLETSLVELRESQREWAEAQRKRLEASSEELRLAAKREVKELKRLFRKKKAAKASMLEWEMSLRECYAGLEAVPA